MAVATARKQRRTGKTERRRQWKAELERQRQIYQPPIEHVRRHCFRSCSWYWAEERAAGREVWPATPCSCGECRHRRWPSHYIGSGRISYECWIDGREPEPDESRGITEGMALDEGLTIKRRRRRPREPEVLVAGCERCEGLRPKGDRFCHKCGREYLKEIRKTGG